LFGPTWGGPRKGAGRKPVGERAGVPHRARPCLARRFPVLVTARLRRGLPSLHKGAEFGAVMEALAAGSERFRFRVVHYSVQTNHVHLVAEAVDRPSLSRGMQGLLIRIAKGLNRLWRRRGSVFADRYHDRILRTPREVRNALVYVLHNGVKHGVTFWRRLSRTRRQRVVDPYTSGPWFDGWRDPPPRGSPPPSSELRARPVAAARTWLLRVGWRRHGLLLLSEAPRAAIRTR
jgi:REP element-mobilizing transposase RayT